MFMQQIYAFCMQSLCTFYAPFIHLLYTFNASIMQYLCNLCIIFMHVLCNFMSFFTKLCSLDGSIKRGIITQFMHLPVALYQCSVC
jgi:hypothetical protein